MYAVRYETGLYGMERRVVSAMERAMRFLGTSKG